MSLYHARICHQKVELRVFSLNCHERHTKTSLPLTVALVKKWSKWSRNFGTKWIRVERVGDEHVLQEYCSTPSSSPISMITLELVPPSYYQELGRYDDVNNPNFLFFVTMLSVNEMTTHYLNDISSLCQLCTLQEHFLHGRNKFASFSLL